MSSQPRGIPAQAIAAEQNGGYACPECGANFHAPQGYPCCGHCTHGGLRWHWAPCPWCEEADA
jgi:hypothetical protein